MDFIERNKANQKMTSLRQRLLLFSKSIKRVGLAILVVGLFLAAGKQGLAQEGSWSNPVMISTNTDRSWFSDVVVDAWGQPHVVWNSGRPTEQERMDLLMYSSLTEQGWLEPKDIAVTAYGGYTIRPAIDVDSAGTLHVTFRGGITVYYTNSPLSQAWNASSWKPRKRISGAGGGSAYYSDVAVDDQDGIHVVWNESVSSGVDEKWVWVGTMKGVAVYDSRLWRSQLQAELNSREIYAIIEDDAGGQWFGTDEGVYQFDGYAWQKPGLTDLKVTCAAQDIDGRMWFGTERGVSRYDEEEEGENKWRIYTVGDGLPANTVRAIATDIRGRVWVGTEQGLASYDGQNWTNYSPQGGMFAAEVLAIATSAQGDVWVGTRNGASQYNERHWTAYTVGNGLLSNVVTSIAVAPGNVIWFGTDRGVSRFDGQEWISYTPGEGLVDGAVTALMVDSEGSVWVGTERGVSRYDGQGWEAFELPQEAAGQKITAVAEDQRVNVVCPLCADIFYSHSTDGGKSWSPPINLSNSFTGSVKPQLHLGGGGNVYVTWEEGEDWYAHQGYPTDSRFAHSPDGGNTWTDSTVFSFAQDTPQQITLGVGRPGELVVVWRLPEENRFYYQFSVDNGASWSQPKHIPGVVAKPWEHFSLDAYDAATDSAGHVHLLVLGRLFPGEKDLALIHLEWDGSEWSLPTRIYASSDPPEWPSIDVGVGNKVYATWFTRDQEHISESEKGRYKVWVSFYQADAPSQPFSPLQVQTPTLASTDLEQVSSTPEPTPTLTIEVDTSGLPPGLDTESDEVRRLCIVLSPVALVLLVIVFLRFISPRLRG